MSGNEDLYEVDRESFDAALRDIRHALTVCFASYGEAERCRNDLNVLADFGGLDADVVQKIKGATPRHPTGSANTVGRIATAFHWIEMLDRWAADQR